MSLYTKWTIHSIIARWDWQTPLERMLAELNLLVHQGNKFLQSIYIRTLGKRRRTWLYRISLDWPKVRQTYIEESDGQYKFFQKQEKLLRWGVCIIRHSTIFTSIYEWPYGSINLVSMWPWNGGLVWKTSGFQRKLRSPKAVSLRAATCVQEEISGYTPGIQTTWVANLAILQCWVSLYLCVRQDTKNRKPMEDV